MNVNNTVNKFKSTPQQVSEIISLPAVSDFFVSSEIFLTSIAALFSNRSLSSLTKRLTRVDQEADCFRKKIKKLSKETNCEQMFAFMETVPEEQLRLIKPEFFYPIAKRVNNRDSIQNYARLMTTLLSKTTFNLIYFKFFFYNGRTATMTALFLTELQQKLESDLFVRSVIASLDRLALMNQLDIIIESLEMLPELDLSNTDKKRIAKLFANITNSAVNNSHQASSLIRIAELLRDRKVEMSSVVFNKILEVLNKNFKDTELFESVIQFMKANDVEFTLPIYNTIIDFYSNSDQISKAIEVFNGLGEETVKPDSYTYSILLRGIKNDDEAPEEALEKNC